MDVNPTTELIKPFALSLMRARDKGDMKAAQVIDLYRMYCDLPSDLGAAALCEAAFREWLNSPERGNGN